MPISIREYQSQTAKTDVLGSSKQEIKDPLLGLFGEAGSLLSQLKKDIRDSIGSEELKSTYQEELGDCLWYLCNICTRMKLELQDLCQFIVKDVTKEKFDSPDFGQFQNIIHRSLLLENEGLHNSLFSLGTKAGNILQISQDTSAEHIPNVIKALVEMLLSIFKVCIFADLDMNKVVQGNLDKIHSRWPKEKLYSDLFDKNFHSDEQLPRTMEISFIERKISGNKYYVLQKCNGINIGDRLTDNKLEADDYRFHDVFHLAYATYLGWSPVLRALFKVKRKSDPKIDEVEDGARAILIEEGISTWVFGRIMDPKGNFKDFKSVEYSLLKEIKAFAKGYEVEACPLWQWEVAIVEGFKLFALLKKNRGGIITADLIKHTLTYATPNE